MHFSPTGLAWVQDAYTLVFGGLLLLGARAGDIVGRRRVFFLGLALFAMASFLVGARRPLVAHRRPRPAGHRRGDRRAVVAGAADRDFPTGRSGPRPWPRTARSPASARASAWSSAARWPT